MEAGSHEKDIVGVRKRPQSHHAHIPFSIKEQLLKFIYRIVTLYYYFWPSASIQFGLVTHNLTFSVSNNKIMFNVICIFAVIFFCILYFQIHVDMVNKDIIQLKSYDSTSTPYQNGH